MNLLSNEVLENWIDLLYRKLKQTNIYSCGYYFSYSQISELEELNEKILEHNNQLFNQIRLYNVQFIQSDRKEDCGEAQTHLREIFNELNNQHVKLNVMTKYNKMIELPCMVEEFQVVIQELSKFKQDIKFFKKFLTSQLTELTTDNIHSFIVFVDDYYKDILEKITNSKSL